MAIPRSTAVGAFVFGALALGVFAILMFAGSSFFAPRLRVVAFFHDSVAGLTVGSPVSLRGVRVGSVQDLKVYLKLPDMLPVIRVYMDIRPGQVSWTGDTSTADVADLKLAVKTGLRAQLSTQSLVTGQVGVSLDFHPETPITLVGGGGALEIPTISSDFQRIKDEIVELKLADLAEKARTALVGINQIVGELNGKLGPLVDSVRQTSDDARTTLDTTSESVSRLQRDASRMLDALGHLADTAETQVLTSGKNIDRLTVTAERAAADADKVVANLNNLTAPRSPLRDNLEATLRDLAASAGSLRNFSRDIERNPSVILLGRAAR
jgi:phospholipid/cholesterol/gamma-HCH transport system substrate-binding protein